MRSKPTRVCLLIPSYFPLVGGAELQLSGLLKGIDRDRYAPFVLTRQLPGTRAIDMDNGTPVFTEVAPELSKTTGPDLIWPARSGLS